MILVHDKVIVIAGKDKGKIGEVKKVLRDENRVVVKGVNLITKHVKPTKDQPGQRIQKEAAIHMSNVMIYSEKAKKGVRTKVTLSEAGEKIRVAKATGEVIPHNFKK